MIETSTGSDAEDWRIPQARERLALLRELAAVGMGRVEALLAQPNPLNAVDAYLSCARGMRLLFTLEWKIEEELAALLAGAPVTVTPPTAPPEEANDDHHDAASEEIKADGAAPDAAAVEGDPVDVRRRDLHEHERLNERESFSAFLKLPFDAAIRLICAKFGVDSEPYLCKLTVFDKRGRLRVAMIQAINDALGSGRIDFDGAQQALDRLDRHFFRGELRDFTLRVPFAALQKRVDPLNARDSRQAGERVTSEARPPGGIRAP